VLKIRPDRPNPIKEDTYECGVETEGPTWVQFNFRYYYFALLFVIFDVEAVFLYPWAVSFERVGYVALIEVATFVGVLVIGLLYAWRKNALEWM
jgi:NADH:ubiquinone oxidoreductase subunit 3 (subunit A)